MYRTLVPTIIVLACAVAGAELDHVPQTHALATTTALNPGATNASPRTPSRTPPARSACGGRRPTTKSQEPYWGPPSDSPTERPSTA